jgi:hypothetical protein
MFLVGNQTKRSTEKIVDFIAAGTTPQTAMGEVTARILGRNDPERLMEHQLLAGLRRFPSLSAARVIAQSLILLHVARRAPRKRRAARFSTMAQTHRRPTQRKSRRTSFPEIANPNATALQWAATKGKAESETRNPISETNPNREIRVSQTGLGSPSSGWRCTWFDRRDGL